MREHGGSILCDLGGELARDVCRFRTSSVCLFPVDLVMGLRAAGVSALGRTSENQQQHNLSTMAEEEDSTTPPVVRGDDLDETLYNEYMKDESKLPKLENKVVAITGTTTGLGFHLARTAIVKGAKAVLLLNRASERAKQSETKLQEQYNTNKTTTVASIACDLMDLANVKEAALLVNDIAKEHSGLDVLCCNAGVMMMNDTRTKDQFEVQMQTNQLSHVLLMHLTWESIKLAAETRGEARVVFQSSGARNTPPSNLQAKYFEKCEPMTLGGDS